MKLTTGQLQAQLIDIIFHCDIEEIVSLAWKLYKKSGDNSWRYFAEYAENSAIAEEAWKEYKKDGGKDYKYFAFSEIDRNYIDMVERFLIFSKKPQHNVEFNYS